MTTTTSTPTQQRIQITPDLTLTLAIPTTHNSFTTGASLTGSWLWPSSRLLTHYLTAHVLPSFFEGKSVLELGAGYSALPGLAAARLGARHVTLTDIPDIIPLLSRNVCENVVVNEVGAVEVRSLVWGEEEEKEERERGDDRYVRTDRDYDVVLMSDVFYDMGMMEMLGRTMRSVCGERTRMLGATELRQWTWECLTKLEKEGFEMVELGVFDCCRKLWTDSEGTAGEKFAVYEFAKKSEDNNIVD